MFEHLNNRYERDDYQDYLIEQDKKVNIILNEQGIDYELEEDIRDFAVPC